MGMKHIPDGQDFGAEHFPSDFGFSGSAQKVKPTRHRAPPAAEHNPVSTDEHGGGHDGGAPDNKSEFAHGGHTPPHMHPHGHEVVHVSHEPEGIVHHHAHGGFTLHHHDGAITHYSDGGEMMAHHGAHHAHGGHHGHMQDESTHVGKMQREKKLIAKGIHEHEDHEHHGEHTDIELRRGGPSVPHPKLPRGMKPPGLRPHSPVGKPPAPTSTRIPMARNRAPGGPMDLGVESSAEPDVAGSDQSDLGDALSHGGQPRHRRRHHED